MKALMSFITKRFWLLWCGNIYWTASKVYEDAIIVYGGAIVVYGGAIVVYGDAIAVNESAVCIYWTAVNILKTRCPHQNRGVLYDDAIVKLKSAVDI